VVLKNSIREIKIGLDEGEQHDQGRKDTGVERLTRGEVNDRGG
jgi:hypothetical protein